MKRIVKRMIAAWIWNFAEALNIDLKWFMPIVFGLMMGAKGKKVR